MRILLAGAGGQVGLAIQRLAAKQGIDLVALTRAQLDITDAGKVREAIAAHRPSHVVNAAGYTAVDQAEREPERAHAVNCDGARHLAAATHEHGSRLIHLSTDYVFDGSKRQPYQSDDEPNPLNVYGRTKLAGEHAVMEATYGSALVIRTAWVYSLDGRNFLTTMLRLMRERDEVKVVDDQVGTPTAAASVAEAILLVTNSDLSGIHHWTDAGEATWYRFAVEIARIFGFSTTVTPIITAEFPTEAQRPQYSVLANTLAASINGRPQDWRIRLQAYAKLNGVNQA